ncbi:unnamed protein product [Callosobruchus maculatus]|uniref:Uncharacterized protein n=1 Tax=Callosobruchus maculatus TaxID=64391 RepID=A0A653C2B1_CALMS|nr:unnamed protein product [Callosobruchus maculatus]
MSNVKCETSRKCAEQLVIKDKHVGNSNAIPGRLLNRIKIENSEVHWDECSVDNRRTVETRIRNELKVNTDGEELKVSDNIEKVFIKNEVNQNTEEVSGIDLNSIKSEPSDDDWDECDAGDKSTLNTKVDELEMGMYCEIKEERIINNEMEDNTGGISGMLLTRIINEYNDVPEYPTSENLNIHPSEIKSEIDLGSEEFNGKEMTEQWTINNETLEKTTEIASDR